MRHRSKEWTKLAARGQFNFDARAVIAGKEYYRIAAPQISHNLATDPLGIGNCNAASLKLTVLLEEGESIPEAAEVKIIGRLTDLDITTSTEVLPFGTYWVDTCPQTENLYTLTCYDAMLKTSQAMVDETSNKDDWPKTMTKVVQEIAARIGVGIDPRTRINQGPNYMVPYPESYTMQQVLGWIGACNGGNWTITDEGLLRLVALTAPPDETYHIVDSDYNDIITGSNDTLAWKLESNPSRQVPVVGEVVPSPTLESYPIVDHERNPVLTSDGFLLVYNETGTVMAEQGLVNIPVVRGDLSKGKRLKVSGILMTDEDGNSYAKGDDSGFVIEVRDCPYACEGICADLYKMLVNVEYEPFTAPDAVFDPAAELGDQVRIAGKVLSSIYEMDVTLDIGYSCTVGAPSNSETTRQYPYLKGKDKKIEDALKNAAQAQATADNKNRTFTTIPKPPYIVGDLWTCGEDYYWYSQSGGAATAVTFSKGEIYRAAVARADGDFNGNDWVFASKYTDDEAANAAQKSADHAQESADAAQRSADAAQKSADAAQESANKAQSSADAAQTSAKSAGESAVSAQNAAAAADKKAEEAKTSAGEAKASANAAKEAAAAADAAAQAAQGTANTAKSTADAADEKAEGAGKTATDYIKDVDGGVQVGPRDDSNVTLTKDGLVLNGVRNIDPIWDGRDTTTSMAAGTVLCKGLLSTFRAVAMGCKECYTSPFDSASADGDLIQYTIIPVNGQEARCTYVWDKTRIRKVTVSSSGITVGAGGWYETKKLSNPLWPWAGDTEYGAKFNSNNQCCVPVIVYGFL